MQEALSNVTTFIYAASALMGAGYLIAATLGSTTIDDGGRR